MKRQIKDTSGSKDIDGFPRKETERLVYARRANNLSHYLKYHSKESVHVMIELMYKLYQIDKAMSESQFKYKNK